MAAILYTVALVIVACLLFIYHQLSSAESASSADAAPGAEDAPLVSSGHDWNISCLFVRPDRVRRALTTRLIRGYSLSTRRTPRIASGAAASHRGVRIRLVLQCQVGLTAR